MKNRNIILLLIIFLASIGLITIDNYTIKILSALRAYNNGESEYSKGQKDALLYLSTYINTREPVYMLNFKQAIEIPMGDNLARYCLINDSGSAKAKNYFLMGRNHPEDIPDMIWLFHTFLHSFMVKPIRLWTEAEPMINELNSIGNEVQDKSLSEPEKLAVMKKISMISADLYEKESEFSQAIGDIARRVNRLLLLADVCCILLIGGCVGLYVVLMINRLKASNKKTEEKNNELIETNRELDTFVYSVSHDLRSPINSIKGLINLIKTETDQESIYEYVSLMEEVVNHQDVFILEIIDFFKNKRASTTEIEFSLKSLIETILLNNKFSPKTKFITFNLDIKLDKVITDELRVQMIVNNLVSNAIKYSDEMKTKRIVSISTQQAGDEIMIQISDNGIGIDKKNLARIYDLFFVAHKTEENTGLGLYILMQNIEKLKGRVEVESELGIGTKFTVYLPLDNVGNRKPGKGGSEKYSDQSFGVNYSKKELKK